MPIVINATEENVSVKIAGNYFNWKPKQERIIVNKSIANYIELDLKDSGLAVLPDLMTEDEELTSEELLERKLQQKDLREQLCNQALERFINKYRRVIENNQISLRRDLEQANIKADPAAYASKGEVEAMKLVAKYQKIGEDNEQAKIDEVKKLMGQVKGK